MTLATRLAFALVLVAVSATAAWGFVVRGTSRRLLEAEFESRMESAVAEVREALLVEATQIRDLTQPLCKRGTFFDKALLDYERTRGDLSKLEMGAQLSLRHHAPDEAAARALDELSLVTQSGVVLSSSDRTKIGRQHERLGSMLKQADGQPQLSAARDEAASIEVSCSRAVQGDTLGFVGARKIETILERVGRAHGVALAPFSKGDEQPSSTLRHEVRVVEVEQVSGLSVVATMPRDRLVDSLEQLDRQILASGGITVALALLLAVVLGRSLAKPLRELAHETREVVTGEPRPVKARGGKEVEELANSFNATIDELTRMKKRLAVTERISARREIARQVAHEIKNPLAPIRAAVETLRRLRARDDERFDEYFDEATRTVLEEVHRIALIVSEFTKFQRLPAPNPEPMDLGAAAKHVVSLHAVDPEMIQTGSNHTEPRVELALEEIPEVRADRDQIIQVLTNLVQNGLDAAGAVRSDPKVLVSIRLLDPSHVRITVRDNGPGVPEEMRERLFEPYATSKPSGTGLGLAICQRIVFEHGGEVSYRPATKGGAVFEVRLPVSGPSLLEKPLEVTAHPTRRQPPMNPGEPS